MGYTVDGYLISDSVASGMGTISTGTKVTVSVDPKTGMVSIRSFLTEVSLGYAVNSRVEYTSLRNKFGTGAAIAGTLVAGPVVGLIAGKAFDKDVPQYMLSVTDSYGDETVILLPGRMGTETFLTGLNRSKVPDQNAIDVGNIAFWIVLVIFVLGYIQSVTS